VSIARGFAAVCHNLQDMAEFSLADLLTGEEGSTMLRYR
jgi:hypothetical protein